MKIPLPSDRGFRPRPTFDEEKVLWNSGYEYVLGVDEVGRGAFAGPLVAAGVIFKKTDALSLELSKINDSKLLTASLREELQVKIRNTVQFFKVCEIPVHYINTHGIGKANYTAFRFIIHAAVEFVKQSSLFVLLDGFHVRYTRGLGLKKQKAIVKGDQKSISIAAASIIAKVHRDHLMKIISSEIPQYGFETNVGYGTKFHQNAIQKHGLSIHHRTSFDLEKFLIA